MSREKNIFEKFPKKWPKGSFGKPVRGERGNHDLPFGAKGGEKMDLEHHYRVAVKKSRHGTELFFCIFSFLHEFGFFGQDAL